MAKVKELISADITLPLEVDPDHLARLVLKCFAHCAAAFSETGGKCVNPVHKDNPTMEPSLGNDWQGMHEMMDDSFFHNAYHGHNGGSEQ